MSNYNPFDPESGPAIVDRGLLAGVALSAGLILLAILFGGAGSNFFSITSLLIVLGGTFGAGLIHFSPYDIRHAWGAFKTILYHQDHHPMERISFLVALSKAVRRDGLLVLEQTATQVSDPFLRTALELTVDTQEAPDIRRILETEMRTSQDRAWRAIQVFETLGTYAPAMGLIGTLVGLIQMLGRLEDPATVGPAMAVALITTLYGAILANLVFLPIAGKLRNRADEESMVKAITLEGALSLSKQENPMVVEQRLQSFIPLAAAA